MPTIKFRIDSNGLMLSIAQALHEAADKIADTARIAAEGEKTIAEIKDLADQLEKINKQVSALQSTSLKVEVVNGPSLTETARQARATIASELGAIDMALAGNGSVTMTNATGTASVTVDDEGVSVSAPSVEVAGRPVQPLSTDVSVAAGKKARLFIHMDFNPDTPLPLVGEELVIFHHGHRLVRGVIDTVSVDGRTNTLRVEGEES